MMPLPVGAEHIDPAVIVLIALAVILAGAKVGGHVAERVGQPAVLGELAVGVVLGNLYHLGLGWLHPLASNTNLDMLARLGAVILLFEVGLESTVREMLTVGARSFAVAVLGVAGPWALGWWVGALLLPDRSVYVHAFLGATLTATSVGITARVLSDLGLTKSSEARIILGAAVIDDVLGLVILAVITSFVTAANAGTTMSVGNVVFECVKATAFLAGAIVIGSKLSPRLFAATSKLLGRDVLLATALAFCFVLAALASSIGLAAIVGAYAAGLLLEEQHYRNDASPAAEHTLQEIIRPISAFLVPVFFVLMGMRVDLAAFLRIDVLALAAVLTIAAIVGKQLCALGAWGSGIDRISIGLGMIPRGEVGLIFANIGLALSVHGERLVDGGIYSAVVLTVMTTTLLTPLVLKWRLLGGRSPMPALRSSVAAADLT